MTQESFSTMQDRPTGSVTEATQDTTALDKILREAGYSGTALKAINPHVKQTMVDIVEGRVKPTEAQLKPMIEMLDVADKHGWTWPWQKEHWEMSGLPGWAQTLLRTWGIAGTAGVATALGNPWLGLAAGGVGLGGAVSPTGGGEAQPAWGTTQTQGYAPETPGDYTTTVVGQMTLDEIINELQMQGIPYTDIGGKSEAELRQMLADVYAEALDTTGGAGETGTYPDWMTDLSKVPTEPLAEGYFWEQGALDITGTPGWVPGYDPLWQTRGEPEAVTYEPRPTEPAQPGTYWEVDPKTGKWYQASIPGYETPTPWGQYQEQQTQAQWATAPQNWWEVAEYERALPEAERMGLGTLPQAVGRFTPGLTGGQPLYGEGGAMQAPAGGWQVQTPTMGEYKGMTEDELRQMQSWMGAGQTGRGWQDWLRDIYKLAPPKGRQGLTYGSR